MSGIRASVWSSGRLLLDTLTEWQKNRCTLMAAGLAYYMLISVSPLLLLAVAVLGGILGREEVQVGALAWVEQTLGPQAVPSIEALMRSLEPSAGGLMATIVASLVLVYGSTRLFAAIQDSLDQIWDVPLPATFRLSLLQILRTRLLAFLSVVGIGMLIGASMALSTIGTVMGSLADRFPQLAPFAVPLWQDVALFLLRCLFIGVSYRVLPNCVIPWRVVWPGAVAASLLLALGQRVIGLYFSLSGVDSAYGAAGSVVLLLASFYYISFALLLGAQISRVYARSRV